MDVVERARAIASKARADDTARREANRIAYPRLAAFLDDIRKWDNKARVVKVYPRAKA